MKKSVVFFTILVVLCTMFISVYADSIIITKQPEDKILSGSPYLYIDASISIDGDYTAVYWQTSFNGTIWYDQSPTNEINLSYRVGVTNQNRDLYYRAVIVLPDGSSVYSRNALVSASPAGLANVITSTLGYATSWVGDVVSSLMDGPLSGILPVLAIGIAVAALLVVIKIVKIFGWGA